MEAQDRTRRLRSIPEAIKDLKDHQTGSPASAIRRRIKDHDAVFAVAIADSDDDTSWNEMLFQTTLKSLVSKGVLLHVNGTNYKFSDPYLRRHAEGLRERAESMEERRRADATASHGLLPNPREEPPKGTPKRKTVHAKVKLTEGKIITVVNPEGRRAGDEMETDEEDVVAMENEGGKEHKGKHVKIIPRKVGAKKM